MSSYNWISAVFDKATFVAFDTETTGLKPGVDRVVEIGAIKFDCNGIIARMNILINPEMPIPKEATDVNHITDEMVKDKPTMAVAIHDFLNFIRDCILVIHNATFDISMMNAELHRLGGSELKNKVFDTLIFAKEVYPGFQSYSLQNLAKAFDIDVYDAHRAEDDSRVCMDLFFKAVQHFFEEDASLLENYRKQVNPDDYLHAPLPSFSKPSQEQSLF